METGLLNRVTTGRLGFEVAGFSDVGVLIEFRAEEGAMITTVISRRRLRAEGWTSTGLH